MQSPLVICSAAARSVFIRAEKPPTWASFFLGKKSASGVGTTEASRAEVTCAALSEFLCCERPPLLQDGVCICGSIGRDAECLQLPLALDS